MVDLLGFPGMRGIPGLVHGVTQRSGGVSRGPFASFNLSRSTGDDPDAVARNGRALQERLGSPTPVAFPHQVHGARVVVLSQVPHGPIGEADGLATDIPGMALGALGADCPGALVVDPVRRAMALVHAGWRGTVAGILPTAISTLVAKFGSAPADLRVALGPGIGASSYEVGPDVAEPFRAAFPRAAHCLVPGRGDRSYLDLHGALRHQAAVAGVPETSIESLDLCTLRERDLFFSHRRDGPKTGRHALVAMWT